ncbi:PepSY domain-containing protein [Arcanobacterium hippocoleae]|uniref:PepSY domain-containing protein n=1 Tax=Arcanobacterium hippocoleae TaxID=149017 RepID=UPI00333FDC20
MKQKSEHEAGSPAAVNPSAPMTPERAIELALTVHAGKIASWSLDSDDGRTEYHIEFTDDTEVIVDVATGTARIDD